MKLLLTGEPRSGKTTILEEFIANVSDKQGFITREILENGGRVGFELMSSLGETMTLASINSSSKVRVSRYGVNVEQFDEFLSSLPPVQTNSLLYIDGIGQMQLYSDSFKVLIDQYLNSSNAYIGTITSIYQDSFIKKILDRNDIILFKITPDNRELIREALGGLAANITLWHQLSPDTQKSTTQMAQSYASRLNL